MFVATSNNLPHSGSIHQFTLAKPFRRTQRFATVAPCAFIFQKQSNASTTSDATKLRQSEDSVTPAHAMKSAAADTQQHSGGKDSKKSRTIPRAVEGTNLFSMDDDSSLLTVEDLLTA